MCSGSYKCRRCRQAKVRLETRCFGSTSPLAFIALSTGHRRELYKFTHNKDADCFVCARVCRAPDINRPTRRPNDHHTHTHALHDSITEKCENKRPKYFMACQGFEFDEHYALRISEFGSFALATRIIVENMFSSVLNFQSCSMSQ